MTVIVLIAVGLVVCGLAVHVLLRLLASQGGQSDVDAARTASQALAWNDAFRGTTSEENPPWDGSLQLAPPTQDGGVA